MIKKYYKLKKEIMKKLQLCVGSVLLTAIFMLGLFVNQLSAQTASFTTSEYTQASSDGTTYTWQVPPGVNTINIIAIGGGGGGGAVCPTFSSSAVRGCAGGGGGAYVRVNNYTVTPGDELTIHVGSRGSGHQSCSSTRRGWGGDSWVKKGSTTIALAKGASDVADGAVNEPGTGGQASACIGTDKYSGGNGGKGSTGAWCGSGGGGAAGGGNGGNGSAPTWTWVVIRHDHPGAAGTTSLPYAGNGAAGIVSHTGGTNGTNGSNYGGGGSGGSSGIGWGDADGGDGGPGYVLITYSATCDATPGSISPETWVCTSTDTAIVINSTAAATSTNPGSYMWKYSTDDANWSEISGATAATYTAHATGYYRRYYVVGTCEPVPTPSVYVTRPSGIDPGTIKDGDNNTEKEICAGDAVNITLYKTYSGNVIWQTCPTNSTNNDDWTNVSTDNTYTITSVSATTYVRYIANYTATCGIPSNNVYVITVNQRPVVNSIAAPTNLCPGESSYELIANITSSADITAYTWTGVTSNTGATAQIVPSGYECDHTYSYTLKVRDENGCESAVKDGSFTTTTPALSIGTIADLDAVTDGACNFSVPTDDILTAAVNNALNTSCGNAVTLSNISPAAESPITGPTTVTATATDMCGNSLPVTIPVVIPTAASATITIEPTEVNVTLYFGACDTAYIVPEPTVTIDIPEYSDALNLTHSALPTRLEPGTYNITWTISDPCGNSVQRPQTINVVYPDCPTATIDGQTYQSVRIGCECWTAENLRNTKYSNGNSIAVANIYNSTEYPNETENLTKFGRLYSWYSAMNVPEGDNSTEPTMTNSPVGPYVQGACPEGWAIPTEADYLTMKSIAGSLPNVKSPDVTTWLPGHAGNNPGSGFDAKGAGYYDGTQYLNLLGQTDFWTSTTTSDVTKGVCSEITHVCPEMLIKEYDKGLGFSIRCIKR